MSVSSGYMSFAKRDYAKHERQQVRRRLAHEEYDAILNKVHKSIKWDYW
jgi:hypothetical protein